MVYWDLARCAMHEGGGQSPPLCTYGANPGPISEKNFFLKMTYIGVFCAEKHEFEQIWTNKRFLGSVLTIYRVILLRQKEFALAGIRTRDPFLP